MPKITWDFTGIPIVVMGCFEWCIGFLNCTGTSVQRQYVSIIIMKMGTG